MARVLSPETIAEITSLLPRYPSSLAALLPALHLAQRQVGHLPEDVQREVAEALDVPVVRVREVVSFYTMFYEQEVGRHVVKICRGLSCELCGGNEIIKRATELLGISPGETTADGRVTFLLEECLASCGTGPCLWVDDRLCENLTLAKLEAVLGGLR